MISLVMPTLNRGRYLPEAVAAVEAAVSQLGRAYEIIIVDDGSRDETPEVLRYLCSPGSCRRGIVLESNRGQQNATLAGIRAARYAYVLTVDDDLEYDLQGIGHLVNALDSGCDAAYVVDKACDTAWFRYLGTAFKELVFTLFCGKPAGIRLTSFRGMSRAVAAHVASDPVRNVYISARMLQITRRIVNIPSHTPIVKGAGRYRASSLIRLLGHVLRNYGILARGLRLAEMGEQYTVREIMPCD